MLEAGFVRTKSDFYSMIPDGGELKQKNPAFKPTQFYMCHFSCGQGRDSVPLGVNFGTLWKTLGIVALFLSVQ